MPAVQRNPGIVPPGGRATLSDLRPATPTPPVTPSNPAVAAARGESSFEAPATPARVELSPRALTQPSTTRTLQQTLDVFPNPVPGDAPAAVRTAIGTAREALARGDTRAALLAFHDVRSTNTSGAGFDRGPREIALSQLRVMGDMTAALGEPPSVPPSLENLTAYGRTLAAAPAANVASVFADYAHAFQAHADVLGRPDVQYPSGTDAAAAMPPHVETDNQGRAIQDCQGYALLGGAFLEAAGFERRQFVSGFESSDPAARGHTVAVATRGRETVMVSNWNATVISGDRNAAITQAMQRDANVQVAGRLVTTTRDVNVTM